MAEKQQHKHYKIGLFEDNSIVAVGLSTYFEKQQEFSASLDFSTSNPKEFLKLCKSAKPDLLIIDIISDQTFGLELFEQVFAQHQKPLIIAYTNVRSKQIIKNLLSMGIAGYIPKRDDLEFLDEAFETILKDGEVYLPSYLRTLFQEKQTIHVLTETEKRILPYLLKGYSTKKIAEEFFVTNSAIDFHKKNLFAKFQVNNIASFVKEAIAQGYSRGINF